MRGFFQVEKRRFFWHNTSTMKKRIRATAYWLKHKLTKRFIKKTLKVVFYIGAAGFIFFLGLAIYIAKDLPNLDEFNQRQITESTKIYDREGKVLLYDVHGEEKRTVVPFDRISKFIKDATVAVEDANFYNHPGLDLRGILRAFYYNLRGQKVSQGGSTITQQLIKKSLLTDDRTITRKIKEAILSLELERKYNKKEILGFYLNQIPYGSNAYGVEAAVQTFFNKSAADLTIAESAILAALPNAPTYYSPYGSHPKELIKRKEYIIDRMEKLGYITTNEATAAKKEKIIFNLARQNIKAPHFIMYIKEYLEQKYGTDALEKGGFKVYTTLDWQLQQYAEQAIKNHAAQNEKKYNATNASLVAVDPKNGQILAMVGSRDYFDIKNDGNVNVAIANRQPGSSFKPFAYAKAMEKGYTPNTVLFDLQTNFAVPGAEPYIPKNFDGKFRGPVKLRNALAQSLNIPSVKLLYLVGINDTINLAQDMGITTLKDRSRFGLSLVLGGGEVKLLDMVSAYSVFANEGIRHEKTAILKIEDAKGNILELWDDKPKKVLEPQITRQINDMLSDADARVPAITKGSQLELKDRPVAAKTGTTQEARDGWTIGYTPSIAVGVWVGNNNNTPMNGTAAGYYTATPIWHEFIANATQNTPVEQFNKPEEITTGKPILDGNFITEKIIKINKTTKQLADSSTPPDLIEELNYPEVHTILNYIQKDNPQGDAPQNPQDDPQFFNWEEPILEWIKTQNSAGANYNQSVEISNNNQIPQLISIFISNIQPNQQITGAINLNVNIASWQTIKQVDYFFNDELIATKNSQPYNLTYTPPELPGGEYEIKIKAYSTIGQKGEFSEKIYWQP